jgi:Phosphotransferase enzyme family
VDDLGALREILVASGAAGPRARLTRLPGGVSCLVAVVEESSGAWLVKSPLSRLAVGEEWYADRRRALREAASLRLLDGSVGPVTVPLLHFVDTQNLVVGMELLPLNRPTWKSRLLAGDVDVGVAAALAEAATALQKVPVPGELAGPQGTALFEAMRVGPYYRTTADRVSVLRRPLEALIADSASAAASTPTMVHGDLNPKNVLVGGRSPALLDWEIAHAGDPSFDLGMLSAHLVLKGCRSQAAGREDLRAAVCAFWDGYSGPADRGLALRHVGGIMAARLHGKSPVDYLEDPGERDRALAFAEAALTSVAAHPAELIPQETVVRRA